MKYQTQSSYVFDECKNFQKNLPTALLEHRQKEQTDKMDMKYFQILFICLGRGIIKALGLPDLLMIYASTG